jgi:hypothetical protein
MKWNKLKDHEKFPIGLLLIRFKAFQNIRFHYVTGHIEYNVLEKKWFLYCNTEHEALMRFEFFIEHNADYILLDKIAEPCND